jgi:hypothetical protein
MIVLDELGAHAEMRIAVLLGLCVLRRRLTGGTTARETNPPPAPGQIKVRDRDIALDARPVGSGSGSCLLMEFGGAAIAVAVLPLCGKPVTQELSGNRTAR